jgi:dehydrogenase/reductase SDR family member 7B
MSSYSGEIGLPQRSAYCASKFAVTGLFESLRMEVGKEVDITIICPITVETSFREHSIKIHEAQPTETNNKLSDIHRIDQSFESKLDSVNDMMYSVDSHMQNEAQEDEQN